MTYSDINTLENPLFNSSLNKPIISYSTYIRNKHKDLDCDYWRKHIYDGYIEFDPQYFYGVSNHYKNNNVPLSATLLKITTITNKYLSDKRIYIPGITPKSYYYLSRGYGKSIRELCYFIKLILNSDKSQFQYNPYSPEYTVQNYKSDMENLYKDKIFHKALDYYLTNIHHNHRSNNQEEMSCFKLIANRNNIKKKFHK